jgi:hypothetical protein
LLITKLTRRWTSRAVPMLLVLGLAASGPAAAAGAAASRHGRTVCSGGIVQSGVYPTLLIAGSCIISDDGLIRVLADLTVAPGAVLTDPGGHVDVGGNLNVGSGATVSVGCRHSDPYRCQPGRGAAPRLTVHGGLRIADNGLPEPSVMAPDPTGISLTLINNSALPPQFAVFQNAEDVGDSDGPARADASGGFQAVAISGIWVGGSVIVKGQDDTAIDVSDDTIGRNLIVSDDEDTGPGGADEGPVLAGDLIGDSLDCSHDEPPPSDNPAGEPDRARDGAHGQCRHL